MPDRISSPSQKKKSNKNASINKQKKVAKAKTGQAKVAKEGKGC
jgi:hypothetical protein